MKVAGAYFAARDYECEDTSADKPYDLVARKDGESVFVEVMGTSAGGEQVFLNRNEVLHAQAHHGNCVLFILRGIVVEEVTGDAPGRAEVLRRSSGRGCQWRPT